MSNKNTFVLEIHAFPVSNIPFREFDCILFEIRDYRSIELNLSWSEIFKMRLITRREISSSISNNLSEVASYVFGLQFKTRHCV